MKDICVVDSANGEEMRDAMADALAAHHDATRDERKALIKEALREWLDEKYSTFGKWTAHGFGAVVIAAAAYLIAWKSGWIIPR